MTTKRHEGKVNLSFDESEMIRQMAGPRLMVRRQSKSLSSLNLPFVVRPQNPRTDIRSGQEGLEASIAALRSGDNESQKMSFQKCAKRVRYGLIRSMHPKEERKDNLRTTVSMISFLRKRPASNVGFCHF